jgi:rubrerythrin
MRFEQTRAVLQQQVAPYHRTVSQLYQDFCGQEVSPRNQLMLDYLIDHELRLALAIHDFMGSAHPGVLDYWFKRIEIPFPAATPEALTAACRTDLDQLVGAAIHYKTALIAFFEHLLLNCDDAAAAHLFQTLKDQEEKGMKRFIRHAQGLADL